VGRSFARMPSWASSSPSEGSWASSCDARPPDPDSASWPSANSCLQQTSAFSRPLPSTNLCLQQTLPSTVQVTKTSLLAIDQERCRPTQLPTHLTSLKPLRTNFVVLFKIKVKSSQVVTSEPRSGLLFGFTTESVVY